MAETFQVDTLTIQIHPFAIYNTTEAGHLLRLNVAEPDRIIARLCKTKKLKAQLPSKKEGYRILGQALIDYLMLKGN